MALALDLQFDIGSRANKSRLESLLIRGKKSSNIDHQYVELIVYETQLKTIL